MLRRGAEERRPKKVGDYSSRGPSASLAGCGSGRYHASMTDDDGKLRIDKWLWAARFFKTRAQAQEAVAGGRVHVNGERVKPSRNVEAGDTLEITKGEQRFIVVVERLSDRRGPAMAANTLYSETAASRAAREEAAAMRKLLRQSAPHPEKKPDKRQRRHIIRFKDGG